MCSAFKASNMKLFSFVEMVHVVCVRVRVIFHCALLDSLQHFLMKIFANEIEKLNRRGT